MRKFGFIAALGMLCLSFATLTALGQTKTAAPVAAAPVPVAAAGTAAPGSDATVPAAPAAPAVSLSDSLTGPAKVDYLAGRMLYEDGDPKSAQVKFQASYDLSKDPRLLWNIAACEKIQRHYAKVETLVQRYLTEGGALISEEDRINAQALLSAMQPFLATATILVNEVDAKVYIDNELIGLTPFATPQRMALGVHKIRVEKPGFAIHEESTDVKGGNIFTVSINLAPAVHEGELRILAGAGERISVDGKAVGVGSWSGKVPSGTHVVEVAGDNKLPFRTTVVVTDNQTNSLRAALESREKEHSAVPSWLWWVGGAVVAVGGGIGGYFLLKPEDKEARTPTGTMKPPGTVELKFLR